MDLPGITHGGRSALSRRATAHPAKYCLAAGFEEGAPAPEPTAIFGAIARGADRLFLVPALVAGVLAGGDRAIAAFAGLKVFAYGASPMPLPPLLRRALDTWPDIDFVQV